MLKRRELSVDVGHTPHGVAPIGRRSFLIHFGDIEKLSPFNLIIQIRASRRPVD